MSKKGAAGMPEDLITLPEAADLRGYAGVSGVSKLISRGRIRSYEKYGRVLVSKSELLAYDPSQHKGGRKPAAKK